MIYNTYNTVNSKSAQLFIEIFCEFLYGDLGGLGGDLIGGLLIVDERDKFCSVFGVDGVGEGGGEGIGESTSCDGAERGEGLRSIGGGLGAIEGGLGEMEGLGVEEDGGEGGEVMTCNGVGCGGRGDPLRTVSKALFTPSTREVTLPPNQLP